MSASIAQGAVPLAEVVRGDLVESVHLGHLVVLDPAGDVVVAAGDPTVEIWPRSAVKPLQAVAMVRAGLDLPPDLLALVAASHNGEPEHRDGVRAILARAGLDEGALANTPTLPMYPPAAADWLRAGRVAASITQDCSGKHAGMLATCLAAGWTTDGYLDPDHPLQREVRAAVAELTGVEPSQVTTDGCGAPLFATTLAGLARAFGRLAGAAARGGEESTARVARAMSAHPQMVAGTGREDTLAMRAVPGLVAKIGADGVCAAGLPDGSALAFKVLDGAARPRPTVLAAALRRAGALETPGADAEALAAVGDVPVLGGGRPVGEVRPAFEGALRAGSAVGQQEQA
ncbi:asparaginase [Isoptericola halotolerans]|uniref:L-asparaginase II n=1 Tax=Isoptericola halotolerans TaxID=300560 RepID=A0ABX2A5W5_9MICO|nr:L-asparaginase II [Isoptericola halotolerans]